MNTKRRSYNMNAEESGQNIHAVESPTKSQHTEKESLTTPREMTTTTYRPPQAASATWTSVLQYANQIEGKLRRNAHKGTSWKDMSVLEVYKSLLEELDELNDALCKGESPETVRSELADVGAFCMFLGEQYEKAYRSQ